MRIDDTPPLVIWEITQACDLACSNCRPSAAPRRHSSELTTGEGIRLLEQIRALGNPLMVFTGGDPLKRPDLFTLLQTSVALGLRTNVRASATPLLTPQAIQRFQNCGVQRMAIGLDGWDAASHDAFRGMAGSFERVTRALEAAREIALDTQVHTTVSSGNVQRLDVIADLLEQLRVRAWSLALAGDERENVFRRIYGIAQRVSFDVRTGNTRYHDYLARRLENLGEVPEPLSFGERSTSKFVFISHAGEIHPRGVLSVSAGNIRQDSLADVYRDSSLFRILNNSGARRLRAASGLSTSHAAAAASLFC